MTISISSRLPSQWHATVRGLEGVFEDGLLVQRLLVAPSNTSTNHCSAISCQRCQMNVRQICTVDNSASIIELPILLVSKVFGFGILCLCLCLCLSGLDWTGLDMLMTRPWQHVYFGSPHLRGIAAHRECGMWEESVASGMARLRRRLGTAASRITDGIPRVFVMSPPPKDRERASFACCSWGPRNNTLLFWD